MKYPSLVKEKLFYDQRHKHIYDNRKTQIKCIHSVFHSCSIFIVLISLLLSAAQCTNPIHFESTQFSVHVLWFCGAVFACNVQNATQKIVEPWKIYVCTYWIVLCCLSGSMYVSFLFIIFIVQYK